MRETCARVLAAALMTGAIAFALGAPALFESPRDESRLLKAPPPSLQRSVRVPALPAPAQPRRAERLRHALSVGRRADWTVADATTPSARTDARPRPKPKTVGPGPAPAAEPAPAPEPAPETRELASATPEPTVEAPQPVSSPDADKKTPKGKAKGHGRLKLPPEDAVDESAQPVPAAPDAPAEPCDPRADAGEHGNGKGNGNGNAYGHDK
jgi:hypothetical protein